MKIQSLAVIFIIIIMPITIVFSEYINSQINSVETEYNYNGRLLDSTYDAIKAYQINTINNATSDIPESKVDDIEAAVNTFMNSLVASFGYSGNRASVMKEYIPAVVFTMYDGYYAYSPIENTLTGVKPDEADKEYKNNSILDGLKPYVYYSCRYKGKNSKSQNFDIVITYTLDNYITIDGTINNSYIYDYGYLVSGITKSNNNEYTYDGITFKENDYEELKEFVGEKEYSYAKINGTKFYYFDEGANGESDDDYIFYINSSGGFSKQVASKQNNNSRFKYYYDKIKKNNTAYQYYKNAYDFTNRVLNEYGLTTLKQSNAEGYSEFVMTDEIFSKDQVFQHSDSNFNQHRMEVIRKVVETSLSAAIAGFSRYSSVDGITFTMPRVSETDWDLIENNICMISFLQGMSIGSKIYNGYAVVPNNLNKEYVDENDIYILTNNNVYAKVNDNIFTNNSTQIKQSLRI